MKHSIIIILLAILVNTSFSQSNTKNICSSSSITSWNSKPTDIATVSEAKNIIATIIAAIGLKQNFEVSSADVPNAAAVIYQNKRYILYNPDFINGLNAQAGNKWAAISILAHEVGHHLNGHTLSDLGSRPDLELEADEFSGFVLRKLGATLTEAQEAMKIAADYKSSATHPGQQLRLTAIATGWNNAGKNATGKDIAKNSPAVPGKREPVYTKNDQTVYEGRNKTVKEEMGNQHLQQKTQTVYHPKNMSRSQQSEAALLVNNTTNRESDNTRENSDSYILADINFLADEQTSFYVTKKYNVVKVANNQVYIIGKMVTTDSNDYPYIITDDNGTKLWVDSHGNIINANDRKVGLIKAHS